MKKKDIPQGKFGFEQHRNSSYNMPNLKIHKIEGASKHKQVNPGMKHKIQIRKTP